ncbi:MAG: hypothetical protein JW990_08480, partial [Thermoleophilia bacterium]|nr:hypothetical protein [Thermoleophilia bacterium]
RTSTMAVDMEDKSAILKSTIQDSTDGLYDPTRSDASEFIQVLVYDNVDSDGDTTTVAYPDAPTWDSNADDLMFVDARSNVDDDRHRILTMAQRESWGLDFDTFALVCNTIDANGQGASILIDDVDEGNTPYYDINNAMGKGINEADTEVDPSPTNVEFDDFITDGLVTKLLLIAQDAGTYYEGEVGGESAAARASDDLDAGLLDGKVIYVKADEAVVLSGNRQIGSIEQPVVLIIDTPSGSANELSIRGTDDFYGIVIVLGNSTLKGTAAIHGSVYVSGTLNSDGTGHNGEIYYSDAVRKAINRQYTLAVKLVPNSWEEYKVAVE